MAHSRPTPQQIATDLPLDAAREATWQGFFEAGVQSPLIDPDKNIVVGTVGDGVLQAARTVAAEFENQAGGTLISISSRPVMGGVIESGKAKTKKAAKVADKVEEVLARGWTRLPRSTSPFAPATAPTYDASAWNESAQSAPDAPVAPPNLSKESAPPLAAPNPYAPPPIAAPPPMAPPIAAPGAPELGLREPSYGVVLPAKQGTTLLIYGVLGILCCQILAPFTVYYSTQALKTYGELDPGDKTQVKVARILGIIGCVFLILRLLAFVGGIGSNGG